jgi:hypothetical protein
MSRSHKESRQYRMKSISSFTTFNNLSMDNSLQLEFIANRIVETEDLNQEVKFTLLY